MYDIFALPEVKIAQYCNIMVVADVLLTLNQPTSLQNQPVCDARPNEKAVATLLKSDAGASLTFRSFHAHLFLSDDSRSSPYRYNMKPFSLSRVRPVEYRLNRSK